MDKSLKQLLALVLIVFSLTLFGVFLTFAIAEVQATNYYANIRNRGPVTCGQELRNKIISYSQGAKQSVALTEEEDQLFRFQLKAHALLPLMQTIYYFHELYFNEDFSLNNPPILTKLNDYLVEERKTAQIVLNDLKYDTLPSQLEFCRAAIVSSWEEALLLADAVLFLPQEKHKEKYQAFFSKNNNALKLCQREAVKIINFPEINNEDLKSLAQPLACLTTSSASKSRWQNQGEAFYQLESVGELETLLAKKQYHPLLSRYFLTWRAAKQFTQYGGANSNHIANVEYNEKRQELYEIIRQHLIINPQDAWAKNQLLELVTFPDIVRGGAGNSSLSYYYFDTSGY